MARLGRRFPVKAHTQNPPVTTAAGSSGLTLITSVTAGSTVTANNTATLPVVFTIGANQNAAVLPVVTTMTAGAALTLQQSATLAVDFEMAAAATLVFNSAAALPAVFAIGTTSNVDQSSTMSVVTNVTAVPTSGTLTLICSIAAASGTDAMGNAYPQGLAVGIPLGPQCLFDVSGNATIQGNLTVGGTITNASLAAALAAFAASISTLQSNEQTDAFNINALQNQVTTLQNQVITLNAQMAALPRSFLNNLSKLPHQTTSNASAFNATNFANLVNAVNNLQTNLQANGFEA